MATKEYTDTSLAKRSTSKWRNEIKTSYILPETGSRRNNKETSWFNYIANMAVKRSGEWLKGGPNTLAPWNCTLYSLIGNLQKLPVTDWKIRRRHSKDSVIRQWCDSHKKQFSRTVCTNRAVFRVTNLLLLEGINENIKFYFSALSFCGLRQSILAALSTYYLRHWSKISNFIILIYR